MILFLCMFIGIFLVGSVSATTYYVDNTLGDNSKDGLSEENAWKNITKINTITFQPGDSILFKRGETFSGVQLLPKGSGNFTNYITYGSYGEGDLPTLENSGGRIIRLDGVQYLEFNNLHLGNGTNAIYLYYSGGVNASNIRICNIFTDNSITDSPRSRNNYYFENVTGAGSINIQGINNLTILNSSFSSIGLSSGSTSLPTENVLIAQTNISFSSSTGVVARIVQNVTLLNVEIFNNSKEGLYLISNVSNFKVIDSKIYHNGNLGGYSGIATQGKNVSIINTYISNNDANGIASSGDNTTILSSFINYNGVNGVNSASETYIFDTDLSYNENNGYSGGNNDYLYNVTSNYNGNDGFGVAGDNNYVVFDRCTAIGNGYTGGDGFSYHSASSGIIKYSLAKNNTKSAIAHVHTSNVSMYYNVFYHDTGGTINLVHLDGNYHDLYNNIIISRGNLGAVVGVSNMLNINVYNNILYGLNYGIAIGNPLPPGSITHDNNIFFNNTNDYGNGLLRSDNEILSDPLMNNINNFNFSLQWNSPAIDSGIDVNLTTDFDGNPIYGAPDIGAYEYQPPYNISKDVIDLTISNKIRIYGDGKYRHINSTTESISANLTLTPTPTFNSTDYSQWMDVNITTWTLVLMNWSESSDTLGNTTNVTHNVCGLIVGDKYDTHYTKNGTRVLISRYTVGSNGCIQFNYTQGYSTVIFDMQKYTVPPIVEEESTTSSGGGLPTYTITQSNLQEGYSKILGKSWGLEFKIKNETHGLKIDDIQNNSATITISSNPITFNLSINETKKIDLEDDGFYDVSVLLKNITGNTYYRRAEVFVKSINEETSKIQSNIPEESNADENSNNQENNKENKDIISEKIKDNKLIVYEIIGIILITIVIIFLILKFKSKKKRE
jgi:hypothetical protein